MKTYSASVTALKHRLWGGVPKDQPPEFWQLKQRLKGEEMQGAVSVCEYLNPCPRVTLLPDSFFQLLTLRWPRGTK